MQGRQWAVLGKKRSREHRKRKREATHAQHHHVHQPRKTELAYVGKARHKAPHLAAHDGGDVEPKPLQGDKPKLRGDGHGRHQQKPCASHWGDFKELFQRAFCIHFIWVRCRCEGKEGTRGGWIVGGHTSHVVFCPGANLLNPHPSHFLLLVPNGEPARPGVGGE